MNGHKICPLCHVRSGNDYTNSSFLGKLGIVYQLPAQVEKWHATHGKTIPSWRSLYMFTSRIKENLLSLQTRNRMIMGDIHTLNIGLATFHMDKDGSDLNTERIQEICIK